MKSILVVSGKEDTYHRIASSLSRGFSVKNVPDRPSALELLQKARFDPVFIDLGLLSSPEAGVDLREAIESFRQLFPSMEIIVMARPEQIRKAVSAIKAGASDYLTCPPEAEEIKLVLDNIKRTQIMRSELD